MSPFEQSRPVTLEDVASLEQHVAALDSLMAPVVPLMIAPGHYNNDPTLYRAAQAMYRTAYAAGGLAWEAIQQKDRAEHDKLTGLRNRETWLSDIDKRIEKGEAFSVALVDLDKFKAVNDSFGHESGDTVLILFANFMRDKLMREDDSWRLGGDEFGLLSRVAQNPRHTLNVKKIAERETEWLETNFSLFVADMPAAIRRKYFNVSVGVAVFDPAHPVDAKTLVAQADLAMYAAKEKRKAERRSLPDRRKSPALPAGS